MSRNHTRTFKAVQKRMRTFFVPDNCYRQDMDTGFQVGIKIAK